MSKQIKMNQKVGGTINTSNFVKLSRTAESESVNYSAPHLQQASNSLFNRHSKNEKGQSIFYLSGDKTTKWLY